MHKAVLEDRFDHSRVPHGHCVHSYELRLHIGWKRRIRRRANIHRLRAFAVHIQSNPIVTAGNLSTRLFQLGDDRIQDIRPGALYLHSPTCHGSGYQKRARFNTVGHDIVFAAVKFLNALNGNSVSTLAADFSAHLDQTLCQVDDFWLAGSVL